MEPFDSSGGGTAAGTSGAGTAARSEETAPEPRPRFFSRPGVRLALSGLALGAAVAVAVPVVVLAPYVVDDVRLDRVVRAVALDWRDFGEPRARERLEYELDHQGIGPWVDDDDCALGERDGERTVTCAWGVALPIWFTDKVVPVTFLSTATVDASGGLR